MHEWFTEIVLYVRLIDTWYQVYFLFAEYFFFLPGDEDMGNPLGSGVEGSEVLVLVLLHRNSRPVMPYHI